MNSYVSIRDNLSNLVERLEDLQKRARDKSFYYNQARPGFNKIRLLTGVEGDAEKAALLIYLNKTCYNGLYRVNRKGEFNVPWGEYKNPQIYDEKILETVHHWLHKPGIRIKCEDYKTALASAQSGDFVYLDPPYQPISPTSNFTDYTTHGFTLADQKKLGEYVSELDARGCLVMVSNSHHSRIRSMYDGIAQKGCVETVYAARAISSVGTGRGKIPEYLITNYKVS